MSYLHLRTIIQRPLTSLAFLLMLGFASVAGAQGTTTDDIGAPNTGSGGDKTLNLVLLGTTGVATLLGALYLVSHRSRRSR